MRVAREQQHAGVHDDSAERDVSRPVVKRKELDRHARPLPRGIVADREQQAHQEIRGQESDSHERDCAREIDGRHQTILRRAE